MNKLLYFFVGFLMWAGSAVAAPHYLNVSCTHNGTGHGPACAASAGAAGAWNLASTANTHTYAEGDDLYLRDGVTISGVQIKPGLNGSASDKAILGSYYSDTGDVGKPSGGAIVNGNGVVPTSRYAGLVSFATKNYITIQDLRILNSYGRGIDVTGGGTGYYVTRNYVQDSYENGMNFRNCLDEFEISYNELRSTNESNSGASIQVVGSDSATPCASTTNGWVHHNTVIESQNEGIDIIKGIQNVIVEYNTVMSTDQPHIYFDRNVRYSTIRNNLVYGFYGQSGSAGPGIKIEDESATSGDDGSAYAGSIGNKIHSNVVVNCASGILFNAQHADATFNEMKIFNNTLIDNGRSSDNGANLKAFDITPGSDSNVKNNISWITASPLTGSYAQHAAVPTHTGTTFSYNIFTGDSGVVDTDAQSSTDPGYPTYPDLTIGNYLAKSTGWNTITQGSISFDDIALQSTASSAIDQGGWLTTITTASGSGTTFAVASQYFTQGDEIQIQNDTASVTVVSVSGLSVTVDASVSWTQGEGVALAYSGTGPDIGASEYTTVPATCGDGSCNGSETCTTCAADCGACPPDDPTTTGITFWANMESAAIYLPTGSSTWTAAGTVAYNSTANKTGTNGADVSAASSALRFTLSGDTIADDALGSMAFWVKFVTSVPTGNVIKLQDTVSSKRIYTNVQSENHCLKTFDGDSTYSTLCTDAGGVTTDVWYGVVVRWDTANTTRAIEVYDANGDLIDSASSSAAWSPGLTTFNRLEVGPYAATNNTYFDALIGISKAYDTDWQEFLTYSNPPLDISCDDGTPDSWESCATCPQDWGDCPTPLPEIKLLWDMETSTLNVSAGSATTASLVGSAALNADADKVGTNGLDVPSAGSYAEIALENGTIFPRDEVSVGGWIRYQAFNTSGIVWNAYGPGGRIYVSQLDSGELRLNIYDGTTYYSLDTDDADLTTGAWYYIVAKVKQSASDRFLGVYDVGGEALDTAQDLSTAFNAPTQAFTSLRIGGTNTIAVDAHYDGIVVSNSYATDVLALRDTISTPTPDPADLVAGFLVDGATSTVFCTVAGGCDPVFTYDNTGTGLTSCTWVWGDGGDNLVDAGCDNETITHDYAATGVGVRSVSLTITDGDTSNTKILEDIIVVGVGSEVAAPTLSIVPTTGGLLPAGTTLGVTTSEDAACKWDTSDELYSAMANTFSTDDNKNHTSTETLAAGESDTYYVACQNAYGTVTGNTTWTARVNASAWYAGTDGDFDCSSALPTTWLQSGDRLVWGAGCAALDGQSLPNDFEVVLDCESCEGAFAGPTGGMRVRIRSFAPAGDVQIGSGISVLNKRIKRGGVTIGYVDDPNYWWLTPAVTPMGNDEYLPGFVWHAPTGE